MKWVKLTLLEAANIKDALRPDADDDELTEARIILFAAIHNAKEEEIPLV